MNKLCRDIGIGLVCLPFIYGCEKYNARTDGTGELEIIDNRKEEVKHRDVGLKTTLDKRNCS